jgi:hypothetical protein
VDRRTFIGTLVGGTLLRYGARGDLKSKNGDTAAEIMSRKRDPEFKTMTKELSG